MNQRHNLLIGLAGLALTLAASADAAPHPYHDDQGLIAWRPSWSAAVQEARATGKPLYIELTHDDEEGAAFVTTTLTNKDVQKLLRRYFVCVVLSFGQKPLELERLCKARSLTQAPVNLFLTSNGDFLHAHQRNVSVSDFQKTLQAILASPRVAATKSKEKELERLSQNLAQAVEARDGKKILATLQAIEKIPGVSPAKSRAYKILDDAEGPAWDKLAAVGFLVRIKKFPLARVGLEEAQRLGESLPVARDVQAAMAALPLLEEAARLEDAKEARWKEKVVQEHQRVLAKHSESTLAVISQLYLHYLSKMK